MTHEFYVNYSITGLGDFQVGPYPPSEAEFHRWDIKSYEGVHSVFVTPTPSLTRRRPGDTT